MSEIHYNVFSLPAALMIEHDMADGLVQTLNNYLDKERLSQDKKSAGDSLIGQIHQGEQLEMDYELEELKVHSYAGDYNPIHDHLTSSPMGISFTCWTKIPDQIAKPGEQEQLHYDLYNSSGAIDGYINFTYGLNQTGDPERLRPSQSRYVKPEVGKLLMFPSWMQHCVYPFFGDGERRTVAGNLNAFNLTPEQIKEASNGV